MFTNTEGKNARKDGAAALTMAASVRYQALDVEEKTRLNAVASELISSSKNERRHENFQNDTEEGIQYFSVILNTIVVLITGGKK